MGFSLKRAAAERVRKLLCERFPATFCAKGTLKRPLKIGIFQDIRASCPDIPWLELRAGLGDYCRGPSYQVTLIEGAERIDLYGRVASLVTKEQAERAAANLAKRPEHVRSKWIQPNSVSTSA
jgi:sRNA-binding protein